MLWFGLLVRVIRNGAITLEFEGERISGNSIVTGVSALNESAVK